MKKLLLMLLILSLSFTSYAWDYRDSIKSVIGGKNTNVSCNVNTDYLGNKEVEPNSDDDPIDYIECVEFEASCSGTVNCNPNTANKYSTSLSTGVTTISIYSGYTPGTADANCVKMWTTSTPVANGSLTWSAATMSGSGNMVNGQKYWMCWANKTNVVRIIHGAGSNIYCYKTCTGCADAMPANLAGMGNYTTMDISMYITIGQ